MAINPYTLNNLYQHGIIDYVDPELCGMQGIVPMNGMMNPYNNYMNSAMQGDLYRNHGMARDSFNFTGSIPYDSTAVGSKSNSFTNMLFGDKSVGTNYQGDILGTGDPSVGAYYQGGFESAHGGFSDVRNNINGGVSKAASVYNNTPAWLKGILAIGVGILGIKMLFRGKGKKAVSKNSFWSKLNPKNWGKPQPQPKTQPQKTSFLSKFKFWK